ncbi:unnamed protein product [marine sediment metagenome]|uniref:Uncharacterized protein n=1 Tax=marine sediment metagenome TaxID=412755 RepID=X1PW75_9ZZZZ
MDLIQMPPKLAELNTDETTTLGLRLMRCFLTLRDRRHRAQLLALAERLVKEEETALVESAD